MDAVSRLLTIVAQRRGVLSIDLGSVSDVVMTYRVAGAGEIEQTVVCEPDVEATADAMAREICGAKDGRRGL